MRVAQWSVLVSLLVILAVLPGIGGGQTAGPDADRTVTTIEIEADGSAVWTVEVWTRLADESEVERFRRFQDSFHNDSSQYVDPFEARIRDVVARAANETGREMQASNFSGGTRVQEVPRRWGIVEYRFRWANFASQDGDRLRVGDVFEGGYFLTANDTLRIEIPQSFERTTVEPKPERTDGRAIEWTGAVDFADGRPYLILAATEAETGAETTDGTTRTSSITDDASFGFGSLLLPLGGIVFLGVLLLGGFVYMREDEESTAPSVTTDSEEVITLLEANGGRMKQAAIGDELGWTASKTSRVLSSMEDAERIERIRIGRENVVDLREVD